MRFVSKLGILFLIFWEGTCRATSIVILRTADQIYVGADSRRSYQEVGETYTGSVCKIVPAGRFTFVASGLTVADKSEVDRIGGEVGRASSTVDQAMETFRGRMATYLPSAIAARSRVQQPGTRAVSGLVLEAAFLGVEKNVAKVSVEWFRIQGSGPSLQVTTDRRTYASYHPGAYDTILLGKRRAIDQLLQRKRFTINGAAGATQSISRLINLEISESPGTTAGPIDILEITAEGARWLQRKAGCDATAKSGGFD